MPLSRRQLLSMSACVAAGLLPAAAVANQRLIYKRIPSSNERLPAIGLGSWLTFDVEPTRGAALQQRIDVVDAFFRSGGSVLDSSPMYGASPDVIGHALKAINNPDALFSASKVWTLGADNGITQMSHSASRWGLAGFDLMQIHNMLDWRAHYKTLSTRKKEGQLRYLGITTSHGRRHPAMAAALKSHDFDFVQFTYNIADRKAERMLLPLAADRGVAVIVNRPFRTGDLLRRVAGKPLPPWAGEIGCRSWPQFMLKFVISHPAVTVVIPATRQLAHALENMIACRGVLPDERQREAMAQWYTRVTT